jgi:hypothetical protein
MIWLEFKQDLVGLYFNMKSDTIFLHDSVMQSFLLHISNKYGLQFSCLDKILHFLIIINNNDKDDEIKKHYLVCFFCDM